MENSLKRRAARFLARVKKRPGGGGKYSFSRFHQNPATGEVLRRERITHVVRRMFEYAAIFMPDWRKNKRGSWDAFYENDGFWNLPEYGL